MWRLRGRNNLNGANDKLSKLVSKFVEMHIRFFRYLAKMDTNLQRF